jgi:hypothetical protein
MSERSQARTRHLGQPAVAWIGDDIEQVLNAMASDPCHDSELDKMRADRIDHGGLLPDEEMAYAVERPGPLWPIQPRPLRFLRNVGPTIHASQRRSR